MRLLNMTFQQFMESERLRSSRMGPLTHAYPLCYDDAMTTTQENTMTFEYTHLSAPDSSAIERIAYNEFDGKMYVQFTGGNWVTYPHVSVQDYADFIEAPSAGRYYNAYIRPSDDWKSDDRGWSPLDLVESDKELDIDVSDNVVTVNELRDDHELKAAAPYWYGESLSADAAYFKPQTKARYSVSWQISGGVRGGVTEVQASSEHEALLEFNNQVEMATPFMGKNYFNGLKVTAVTRYFD